MMQLLFQGEFSLAVTAALAAVVAVGVVVFYRRETRTLDQPLAWVLPGLRGAAVFLTLLMLSGPILQFRRVIGDVARVDVFIDTSGSMLATDAGADAGGTEVDAVGESQTVVEPSPGLGPDPAAAREGEMRSNAASGDAAPLSRLQRAWRLVSGSGAEAGWLESVRSTHHVFLHALSGDQARLIWDSQSELPIPTSIELDERAASTFTNLSDPVAQTVLGSGPLRSTAEAEAAEQTGAGAIRSGPRRAIVLLSDGQHNAGPSPQSLAQHLGDASIAIHTIGIGSEHEPRDVAILGIDAPASVSASGRASGTITIKDLAGEGEPLKLRILFGDQTVWQQSLQSENRLSRRVAFDFAVAPWVQQLRGRDAGGVERTRLTLPLTAVIDPIQGQYDASNNQLDFRMAAALRQRRVLIVDSRARWETRYLRNLLDRDPTWQVETVLAWPRVGGGARRFVTEGVFPEDSQAMASYDAVIWGDVGIDAFSTDQFRRLRDFAAQGGAVVFIDGFRDGLLQLDQSPIGPLLPVRLSNVPLVASPRALTPTAIGGQQAALRLVGDGRGGESASGAEDNLQLWRQLQPPTVLRRAEVLPGSEVWLEATLGGNEPPLPVLVTRLFGGGQVVYLAMDQTWRWRYRVADRYHARFWNQLLEAIMQPPFEVRDQYVALTTGAPQYTAGEQVPIRARLRDANGQSVGDAIVEAVLQDQAGKVQTVLLHSVDADRGVYEARSQPLSAGEYEVSVRAAGYQSSQAVKTSVLVVPPINRETARLALAEDLLRWMSEASGGVYADESEAARVWRAIRPLSEGRIETQRLDLAQSYLWFFAVLGLLTGEWWLRKKAGLV